MSYPEKLSRDFPVLHEVKMERAKQDKKWGEQNHSPVEWIAILTEEVGEASQACVNSHFGEDVQYKEYRAELIQVAAVAVAMVEALDRNKWSKEVKK